MHNMSRFTLGAPVLAIFALMALPSCFDQCPAPTATDVGGEFFTVTYLDTAGVNYLTSVYNPNGIVVYLDSTGGEDPSPEYERINPGYANGKFGPFEYTERYIDPRNQVYNDVLLYGKEYSYDYYIRKDVFGVDTFRVSFLLKVDECSAFWGGIRYYRNGQLLNQYNDQRMADIVIIE